MKAKSELFCRLAAGGNLFRVLLLSMIVMGLLIGLVFPFFVEALGLPSGMVMRPSFFAACILAGLVVGEINYLLARFVLAAPLKALAGMAERVASGNLKEEGGFFNNRES
ncbi:hypothetical protein [Desulfofundulus sp.]|uniref:hypothetical protein n=1 Tax=Desulfofundulus sp. TaxID=2282750 RepID=UPI003C711216